MRDDPNFSSKILFQYQKLPKIDLSVLPWWISRWLGYRPPGWVPHEISWVRHLSIFLITFAAMLANEALSLHAPLFIKWHFKSLVPSYAASCILIFGAIQAPFSQPRNLVLGHFISALVGVCIMKLFMTNSHNEQYLWVAGSLSVAISLLAMDLTGTIHPPSGATALLPSVDDQIRELSWNYLPLVVIHSLLYLAIALVLNNIYRRYPAWWIGPNKPSATAKTVTMSSTKSKSGEKPGDLVDAAADSSGDNANTACKPADYLPIADTSNDCVRPETSMAMTSVISTDADSRKISHEYSPSPDLCEQPHPSSSPLTIIIPEGWALTSQERTVLADLQRRLLA